MVGIRAITSNPKEEVKLDHPNSHPRESKLIFIEGIHYEVSNERHQTNQVDYFHLCFKKKKNIFREKKNN